MEWTDLLKGTTYLLKDTCIPKERVNREDELMLKLWADQRVRQLISLWLEYHYDKKDAKSIEKAQSFKQIGNEQFQRKQYNESIQSYTESAVYAPPDSCELPIAYANRSASLFYLNRYNDCIKDIELAIKLNYPKKLHYKIYLRAVQCYLQLGKTKLARETLSKINKIIDDPTYVSSSMKDSIKKKVSEIKISESDKESDEQNTKSLLKLKSHIIFEENINFSHASKCIDIKYNEELGRHVVANRLIKKGEFLFFEKPVIFALVNYDTLHDFCQHCMSLNTDIPIVCSTCLCTYYCSEKCLNEAWSAYHCWECPGSQMNLWKQIGMGHLAIKLLLTCSTTVDKIKFNEIQNLITNFDKISMNNLIVYGITALMLTTYLLKYTDFFKTKNIEECLMNKFSDNMFNSNFDLLTNYGKELYVSSLLMRHIIQLISNAYAISNSNTVLNKNNVTNIIASGVYSSASIMNHSCDPNVINIFMDQYLIVRASRDIAADEQVLNCYGQHYKYMVMEKRQNILKVQYCFTCKCKPCTLPKLQYFVERFNAMKCSKCDGALCEINNYLHCIDCGNKPHNYYQNKIIIAEGIFEAAQKCFELGKNEEALDKLHKCLSIRRTELYKYNEDITDTLNYMAEIFATIGQWRNSIACLEETIVAIKERYGDSSIELLDQLNTLTDRYLTYLQKESKNSISTYKDILKQIEKYSSQIEDIANLHYGSWSKVYEDVKAKKEKVTALYYNIIT